MSSAHPAARLNQLLNESDSPPLGEEKTNQFITYLTLLQKWSARTNLTAIRDEEGILSRHFLESILCARLLVPGLHTLLDFGSGAGFPGLPIAILHPEIAVTLAESQHKKAAFLREAIRTLGVNAKVHSGRAEELTTKFDCVTLRGVDDMATAIPAAVQLIAPNGCIAILTTIADAASFQSLADQTGKFTWSPLQPLPQGTERVLLSGHK
jgi:16S rRNA (guanine527-N7)-methyltransferase